MSAAELVFRVRLQEGDSIRGLRFSPETALRVARLPERDDVVVAFLVGFELDDAPAVLAELREVAETRSLAISLKRQGRTMTLETNDDGLDLEVLSGLIRDFYRDAA